MIHVYCLFHKIDRTLRCHHCGYTERVPRACPACGNVDIAPVGRGTEQLEEQIAALLAQVQRPGDAADDAARPVRVAWSSADGRSGQGTVAPEGVFIGTGAGVFDVTLSAGPAFNTSDLHIEVAPGADASIDTTLRARIEPGTHVLADLALDGAASRRVRQTPNDRTAEGSGAVAGWADCGTGRCSTAAARTGAGLPRLHSVGRAVFRARPPRRLRCQRRH
jgi:hypothetical protein